METNLEGLLNRRDLLRVGSLGLAGSLTDGLAGTWAGPLGHTGQHPRTDRRRPPPRPWQAGPDFDDRVAGAHPNPDPNPA